MRDSPRIRRLRTDLRALEQLKADSTILDFDASGDPPESYTIRFHGRGLCKPDAGAVLVVERHEVSVRLGASYPRMMPELAWKTPIFHPNISAGGVVCLGGYGTHWVPSLNLDELCEMLWDMVRYANFDVESPYNREAAAWTKTQRIYDLPVDARPLRDKLAGVSPPREGGKPPLAATPRRDAADAMVFLDDEVIEAEIVNPDDSDILFIE